MAVNCPVCGGLGYELVNGLPEECENCEGKGYVKYIKELDDDTDRDDE